MQIKFVRAAILLCLLSLAGFSFGEYVITTADGNGADAGLSNDSNKHADWYGGGSETVELRNLLNTRAKCAIFRFDLGSGIGGDSAGAVLSIIQSAGTTSRTLNIFGLVNEEEDNWDESSITYDTAPGFTGPYVYTSNDPNAAIYFEEGAWELLGSIDAGTEVPYDLEFSSELLDSFIAADTNQMLTLCIYVESTDGRSFYAAMKESSYDPPTLTFPNASFATDPSPALDEYVLTTGNTLSWANPVPESGGAITCDVYLGQNEPNFVNPDYDLVKVAEGTADTSLALPTLDEGKYYWVIDSYEDGTFLGNGAVWYFNVTAAPQVVTGPSDQILSPGDTALFDIDVASVSAVNYTWYMSTDNANNTPSDDIIVNGDSAILTIGDVSADNEGFYFCKAVNSSGEAMAAYSDTARLVVQRQVAHWTLDELTGGVLSDTSGEGNDAVPSSEAVAFSDGANVLTTGMGAVFADSVYAQAGTLDPTYVSGEFSLSFWMKWDGGDTCGVIAKHNDWAADTTQWQLGIYGNDLQIALLRAGGTNLYGTPIVADQWYYVAVTFDGSTANIYTFQPGSDSLSFDTATGSYSLGSMADADFNIGCAHLDQETGDPLELFNGTLDEIQVFNYAKSATEIADLYNQDYAQDFCILEYGSPEFDLDVNNNCRIDIVDFAELMDAWLECGLYPNCQ